MITSTSSTSVEQFSFSEVNSILLGKKFYAVIESEGSLLYSQEAANELILSQLIPIHTSFLIFYGAYIILSRSRDTSVGIATGYGLDDRGVGVRAPVGSRIFSSPRRPDRPWSPPNLLSNGYLGLFPRG
jgi:hypothetical protein